MERLPAVSSAAVDDPPPLPPEIQQELLSLHYPRTGEQPSNVAVGIAAGNAAEAADRHTAWNAPAENRIQADVEAASEATDPAISRDEPSLRVMLKTPIMPLSPPASSPTEPGTSLRFIIP